MDYSAFVHPLVVFVVLLAAPLVFHVFANIFLLESCPFARLRTPPGRRSRERDTELGLRRRVLVMLRELMLREGDCRRPFSKVGTAAELLVLALKFGNLLRLQFDVLEEMAECTTRMRA